MMMLLAVLLLTIQMVRDTTPTEGSSVAAYPAPDNPDIPEQVAQPYPAPGATSIPPTPVPTVIPGPPPNWPTELPWPPVAATPQSPLAVATFSPFPTPVFQRIPEDNFPEELQQILLPHVPAPGSPIQVWNVDINAQGWYWQHNESQFTNLALPDSGIQPSYGPYLTGLYPSPHSRWVVIEVSHWIPQIVDIVSRNSLSLFAESTTTHWQFLAWHPDGQRILVSANEKILSINLASGASASVDLDLSIEEHPSVRAMSFSPDGLWLADAVVYSPVRNIRDHSMLEIGIRDRDNARRVVSQIPNAGFIIDHSLLWSPDGKQLLFVANSHEHGYQVWAVDVIQAEARMLMPLTNYGQYASRALWSPDGHYIAVIKAEDTPDGMGITSNIFLINVESGTIRQVTDFSERQLSHLHWSPDSQMIAFAISMGDYGEIWGTSLDGTQQYPIAGPTITNAPFIWLP